jgi:hypothetical protein
MDLEEQNPQRLNLTQVDIYRLVLFLPFFPPSHHRSRWSTTFKSSVRTGQPKQGRYSRAGQQEKDSVNSTARLGQSGSSRDPFEYHLH